MPTSMLGSRLDLGNTGISTEVTCVKIIREHWKEGEVSKEQTTDMCPLPMSPSVAVAMAAAAADLLQDFCT